MGEWYVKPSVCHEVWFGKVCFPHKHFLHTPLGTSMWRQLTWGSFTRHGAVSHRSQHFRMQHVEIHHKMTSTSPSMLAVGPLLQTWIGTDPQTWPRLARRVISWRAGSYRCQLTAGTQKNSKNTINSPPRHTVCFHLGIFALLQYPWMCPSPQT